jgi:hypothetical protein
LPEVLDNSKRRGGLDNAFSDKSKTFAFNYVRRTTEGFFINRDAVSEQELRDADGLWEPKWQGKIAWHDPREVGAGVNAGLLLLIKHGEKRLRDLWAQQKVAVVRDQRQLIEWTVRARQPVAAGLIERELKATFQANGVGLNVKPLPIPGIVSATRVQTLLCWLIKRRTPTPGRYSSTGYYRRADKPPLFRRYKRIACGRTFRCRSQSGFHRKERL